MELQPGSVTTVKWLKDDRYAPAVDVVPEADGPVFLPVEIEASASVDLAEGASPKHERGSRGSTVSGETKTPRSRSRG